MRFLIAILALIGVWDANLALRVHNSNGTEPCSINEQWDCGVVNHSPFAEIHQIPVAEIGIAGYSLLVVLSLAGLRVLLANAAVLALTFSLYLTYIEKYVLQVFCVYCVLSLALVIAITALSLWWALRPSGIHGSR